MIQQTIQRKLAVAAFCLAAVWSACGVCAASTDAIIKASGVKGGLVVVIGCDDPALMANLHKAGPYLVRGLDADAKKVAAGRKVLLQHNLYGPIALSQLRDRQLPYSSGLVNMIVVTTDAGVEADEMTRVLCPGGVIADIRKSEIRITRKARPRKLDEWTHYLYDATNNAVSKDTVIAPPRGIRWTAGPKFARSHEHFASVSAMVAASGRIFYIIDEGPISSVYSPPKWRLVARDAFSGVLLWKKPIDNWESHLRGFRSGPPEIGRVMLAKGDKVYVSLGHTESVTVLDAASGKTIAVFKDTGGARELLLDGDVLYVLADDMTRDQHDQRRRWIKRTWPKLKMWYNFPRTPVRLYGKQRVIAVDAGTGEQLWTRGFTEPGEIMPATMAVSGGKVCLQTVSHTVCLNAADGRDAWRSARPVARSRFSWSTPTLVVHDGVVVTIDRAAKDNAAKNPPKTGSNWIISSGGTEVVQKARMFAFALNSGKKLWSAPYFENYNAPQDVFVIDQAVWTGAVRRGIDPGFTIGRDLKTGKVTKTIPAQKGWGHHRCYRNKATTRWIIMGRGGIQFVDPKGTTGPGRNTSWARGGCQYGVMPANGMIYTPQHSCACNPESLITGLNALTPQSNAQKGPGRLEKGPAVKEALNSKSQIPSSKSKNWATYRGDAARSGFRSLPAPTSPQVAWTAKLAAPITAPVSADGMVFVAERERHSLYAMSVSNGKQLWAFTADGRIDSPPTISRGLCVFGTRNGAVYCLRTSDGALVWRFAVAGRDRRIFSYGQIESAWPVHGSVLVDSGEVCFAAGRSSFSDGGIRLHSLDLKTGELIAKTDVHTAGGPGRRVRRRMLPDILSLQNGSIWMRDMGVDRDLKPVEDAPHLFAPRGFLDDTWWHRTYWLYGARIGGGYTHWPDAGNVAPAGRLLAADGGKLIYGYGRMAYRKGHGHVQPDMIKDYKLFAEEMPQPQARRRSIRWTAELPFVARAIVLTRDALLVAGGQPPLEAGKPGVLRIASRKDGAKVASCALPAAPVLDGMALTSEGVFVSAMDGSVVRLQSRATPQPEKVSK